MKGAHLVLGIAFGLALLSAQNLQAQSSQFFQNYKNEIQKKNVEIKAGADVRAKATLRKSIVCGTYLTREKGWIYAPENNYSTQKLVGFSIPQLDKMIEKAEGFFARFNEQSESEGKKRFNEENRNYKSGGVQQSDAEMLNFHFNHLSRSLNGYQTSALAHAEDTEDPNKKALWNYTAGLSESFMDVTSGADSGVDFQFQDHPSTRVLNPDGSTSDEEVDGYFTKINGRPTIVIKRSNDEVGRHKTIIHELTHYYNSKLNDNTLPEVDTNTIRQAQELGEIYAKKRLQDEFLADLMEDTFYNDPNNQDYTTDLLGHYVFSDGDLSSLLKNYLNSHNNFYQFDKVKVPFMTGYPYLYQLFPFCTPGDCIQGLVDMEGEMEDSPYLHPIAQQDHSNHKFEDGDKPQKNPNDVKNEGSQKPGFSGSDPRISNEKEPQRNPLLEKVQQTLKGNPAKDVSHRKAPEDRQARGKRERSREKNPGLQDSDRSVSDSHNSHDNRRRRGGNGTGGTGTSERGNKASARGQVANYYDDSTPRHRGSSGSGSGSGSGSRSGGNNSGSAAGGNPSSAASGSGQANADHGTPNAPAPPSNSNQNNSNASVWRSGYNPNVDENGNPLPNADGSTTYHGYVEHSDGTMEQMDITCLGASCHTQDGSTFTPMNADGTPMTDEQCNGNCAPMDGTALVATGSNNNNSNNNSGSNCPDGSDNCNNSGGRINPNADLNHVHVNLSIVCSGITCRAVFEGQGTGADPRCRTDACSGNPLSPWNGRSPYGPHPPINPAEGDPNACHDDGCGQNNSPPARVVSPREDPNECQDDGCAGGRNPDASPKPKSPGVLPQSDPRTPRSKSNNEKGNNKNERMNEQDRARVRANSR